MKHSKDISQQQFSAFQKGDHQAFRFLFDTYQQSLYRFAYSVCRDPYTAEEAVQDSFIKLYEGRKKIDGPQGIYPLLFVMTKRYLLRVFRHTLVRTNYQNELTGTWNGISESTMEQVEEKDLHSLLDKLLERLPEKQREIFSANKLHGYSCDEISQQMGTSKHTVKNQLAVASKKIRLQLHKLYSFIL